MLSGLAQAESIVTSGHPQSAVPVPHIAQILALLAEAVHHPESHRARSPVPCNAAQVCSPGVFLECKSKAAGAMMSMTLLVFTQADMCLVVGVDTTVWVSHAEALRVLLDAPKQMLRSVVKCHACHRRWRWIWT